MRRAAGTAGLALLTAGFYALGAALTLFWFDSDGLGPGFFPAAGVTLSALVLTRRERWPWILLAVGLTELTIDVASDRDPRPADRPRARRDRPHRRGGDDPARGRRPHR